MSGHSPEELAARVRYLAHLNRLLTARGVRGLGQLPDEEAEAMRIRAQQMAAAETLLIEGGPS